MTLAMLSSVNIKLQILCQRFTRHEKVADVYSYLDITAK